MKKLIGYFSGGELLLWCSSVGLIVLSFCVFDRENFLTLAASLIGVTSILVNAKGNPLGQLLMIVFSLLYGIISFTFSYYGEMITYLGMTMPMSVFALVSWLRNPYNGKKREIFLMFVATAGVTAGFYFILAYFDTANILPSTISVTTSFVAVYLTFRRSPFFLWRMPPTMWCSFFCGQWQASWTKGIFRWWFALLPFLPTMFTALSAGRE